MTVLSFIQQQLSLQEFQISNTLKLFSDGATIPFIARYRKELTGELDEVQIGEIEKLNQSFNDLVKRKSYILSVIEEKGQLSDELRLKIDKSFDYQELEDLYLPFKSKKQSRAEVARKKGLEPLAKQIMKAEHGNPESLAGRYVKGEIANVEEALSGAQDIMVEWINENPHNRNYLRKAIQSKAVIVSKLVKKKEAEATKFKDYFDWSENFRKMASHRFLAVLRASKEGCVKLRLTFPDDRVLEGLIEKVVGYRRGSMADVVAEAVRDAYKRLLFPSLENEAMQLAKEKADKEAIEVFAGNVRQLLMEAPLGAKPVLAIDPGFRTGCKVVCLSNNGDLLCNSTIFPHDASRQSEAKNLLLHWVDVHAIEAIAIGNGTAGRETESFVKSIGLPSTVAVISVNESGASIYSASALAREEFPDHDITVRGAISIGRRLMDPLAELVKIDPKSIGVGQYQHDVDQKALNASLEAVVSQCVNQVGVELNTASKELLTHVAGLGNSLASNIVEFRKTHGAFKNRKMLSKVPRLGAKAFEQCAGFLRISEGDTLLDSSAVHPESYGLVKQMAKDLGLSVEEFVKDAVARKNIQPAAYVSDAFGLLTIKDILKELDKPGRDPRAEFKMMEFSEGVNHIDDLYEGMLLNGVVSNITSFGCFVDVGVHQDGLVHVSELANKFVKDPNEIVSLKQKVRVKVLSVERSRKRIALSIKQAE